MIGATTTLACFAHEIPHEIADYSILIRSGFTKRQAMQSQYLTAVGAFVSSAIPGILECLAHLFSIVIVVRDPRIISSANAQFLLFGELIFASFIGPHVSPGWVSSAPLLHYRKKCQILAYSTFMGIAIHNLSVSANVEDVSLDLAAAVRQTATGLLGTTVQLADLVCGLKIY